MISRLWTAFLLSLACASTIAWLVALMHEKNVRPVQDLVAFFKKQSKVGRIILGTFFIAMWVIASTKPGNGGNGGGDGGGDGGGTNNVQMVIGPGISPERSEPCEARSLEGCVVATNNWFAPFMASLGIVPEANWNLLDESARPSQLWYCITPQNTLVVTWRNALLDLDTERPISFHVQFRCTRRSV